MDAQSALEMSGATLTGAADIAKNLTPQQIAIFKNITLAIKIWQLFWFISYLLTSWWLWEINKKLGEPHAWMSWVPGFQIYSYVRAAGKPNIWILWLIFGYIFFIIPGIIMTFILYSNISKRTWWGFGRTLWLIFLPFVFFPLVWKNFQPANPSFIEII